MSPQAGWLLQDQIVPRLRAAIPKTASLEGTEDTEELVQDSIALAARMIENTERAGKALVQTPRGKKGEVSAGNIAYFTIEHIRSGRRSTGSSKSDVLGCGTQLAGRTRLNSLEEVVASDDETGGGIFLFHDVLSDDQEDPGTQAARKLDWQEFVMALDDREKAVVLLMIEGKSGSSIARKLRVCESTVQSHKSNLAVKILEFMGVDILVGIRRSPRWKDSINATKERLACKHERSR
jgi:hypothetical protein